MFLTTFKDAIEMMKVIEENGHEAYLVGGCVRDYLLHKQINDIDITTSATPKQLEKMFRKVIFVHEKHDTVIVIFKQRTYEVTTFRNEGTLAEEKQLEKTIYTDLHYRDFTINAIAMDKNGTMIDPFHGKEAIENKRIEAVGDPNDRFREDPLRMLRAIRFVSQFGFEIEQSTFDSIKHNRSSLATVAVERVTNELKKLFQGKNVNRGIEYLKATNIESHLPIFAEHPHLLRNFPENIFPFQSYSEVIAYFHHVEKNISISTWIRTYKCSNIERREAKTLYELITLLKKEGFTNWLVYRIPSSLDLAFAHLSSMITERTLSVEMIREARKNLPIQSRNELKVSGNELIDLFPNRKRGAWIEQLLVTIEKNVVLNKLKNDNQLIKEWILCHPQEID